MADNKKYILIHDDILIEWLYNNGNITENYSIWTNLKTSERNFVSTSNNNKIEYTLFNIDPVIKKYAVFDRTKFNFLKIQNYTTPYIQYDKINIHFPFNYDFGDYIGIFLKIYTYDFENKKIYYLSNYFYDKSDLYIEKLLQLENSFRYAEKEWGKFLTISIPSIYTVSEQRTITETTNIVTPYTINYNLTEAKGLSLVSPIFIDLSFITSKETVLSNTYYYIGDTYSSSLSRIPDYETLGVTIQESPTWDFFEIYGYYRDSNENLDNFVASLESKGRSINIEYIVTLYEENIQSGFPIRFLVTENFSQKIEYRPIFKYSNTTASIDVEMVVMDLVDNSSISRTTSIGLTRNLYKYGKKLSRLNVNTINRPKIYNYRSDSVINNMNIKSTTTYGITKVPYPLIISNYKILLNSPNSNISINEYKTMGTLTILLTPFDNIIKFNIAKQEKENSNPEPYNLSEILSNARLTIVFKSDNLLIEKDIFYESDQNDIKNGIVIFKISESDITTIKEIYEEEFNNFYLTIVGNETRTLLYSGKFKLFEDVDFIESSDTSFIMPSIENIEYDGEKSTRPLGIISKRSTKNDRFLIDEKVDNQSPFQEENLPPRPEVDQDDLTYYRNLLIYIKSGLSTYEKLTIKNRFLSLGLSIYYEYRDTFLLERVHVSKIKTIESISNIDNVFQLKLNLGWGETTIIPYSLYSGSLSTASAIGLNLL